MTSTKKYSPTIAVLATQGADKLSQMLVQLQNANYPKDTDVDLHLCIDQCNETELNICNAFEWKYGKKIVTDCLNKDVHCVVEGCLKISETYGSVIILDTDILISKHFYDYSVAATESYADISEVAGGTLHHHQYNEGAERIFRPLQDCSDVYFLQMTVRRGRFFTHKQLLRFKEWFDQHSNFDFNSILLPSFIRELSKNSWKKWHCAYLVDSGSYMVYPRVSLLSKRVDHRYSGDVTSGFEQQTEFSHFQCEWNFVAFESSKAKYDAFFELDSKIVKSFNSKLSCFDFEVDTFGMKPLSEVKHRYILTPKSGYLPVLGFERSLRPEVSNIIHDFKGEDIQLYRVDRVQEGLKCNVRNEINYSFGVPSKLLGKAIYQYLDQRSMMLNIGWGVSLIVRRFLANFKRVFRWLSGGFYLGRSKKYRNSGRMLQERNPVKMYFW